VSIATDSELLKFALIEGVIKCTQGLVEKPATFILEDIFNQIRCVCQGREEILTLSALSPLRKLDTFLKACAEIGMIVDMQEYKFVRKHLIEGLISDINKTLQTADC